VIIRFRVFTSKEVFFSGAGLIPSNAKQIKAEFYGRHAPVDKPPKFF